MSRYDKLMSRIEGGEQIVIDGGTGTEIERRGVPQLNDAWNGEGALRSCFKFINGRKPRLTGAFALTGIW